MRTFWMTFRIDASVADGRTHEQRYGALLSTIARHAEDHWDDPTSMVLFSCRSTIDALASDCRLAIVPDRDLFVIRELDVPRAIACGAAIDEALLRLMPYVRTI